MGGFDQTIKHVRVILFADKKMARRRGERVWIRGKGSGGGAWETNIMGAPLGAPKGAPKGAQYSSISEYVTTSTTSV